MSFSKHARRRMQQRGISKEVFDYVLAYGRVPILLDANCLGLSRLD